MTAQMTYGFVFTHEVIWSIRYVDEHGVYDHWVTTPLTPLIAWDGPDDDEYHRVSYVTLSGSTEGRNTIKVELASVRWLRGPSVRPGFLHVSPVALVFDWTGEDRTELPVQEVFEHRLNKGGYSQLAYVDD